VIAAALRAILAAKSDDIAFLQHLVPAETVAERFEQNADAAIALVGDRRVIGGTEHEFLVLGADAPFSRRLAPRLEIGDELIARANDRAFRPIHPCRHCKTLRFRG